MKRKEYKRLYNNERRAYIALDKITDECQGKDIEFIKNIEESNRYKKAVLRFQKWHKLFLQHMLNA